MRRIAVINQKGGVGKTTTTANLGAAIGSTGRRVLLIDLDPQAHLTLHFDTELERGEPSVYDVLLGEKTLAEVARVVRPNVTLVPANVDLAGVEVELISVPGREVILRDAVESMAEFYDVMMVDCPPSLGVLTLNALCAGDELMIPLQAHFLALQGLSKLLDTVALVRKRINPELHVGGILLCMFDSGTRLAGEVVEDLQRFLAAAEGTGAAWAGAKLYDAKIRRNIKLAESPSHGKTVFDYAPKSHGAKDYARLAAEVLGEPVAVEGLGAPKDGRLVKAASKPATAVTASVPMTTESNPPAPAATDGAGQREPGSAASEPTPVPAELVAGKVPPGADLEDEFPTQVFESFPPTETIVIAPPTGLVETDMTERVAGDEVMDSLAQADCFRASASLVPGRPQRPRGRA